MERRGRGIPRPRYFIKDKENGMKLREIIADAAGLVGKERLARFLTGTSSDTDGNVVADMNAAVRLANVLIAELSGSYIPMTMKERVTMKNGRVYYSDLSYNLHRMRELQDKDGNVLFFVLHAEYAEPRGEALYAVYDYIPKVYALTDDVGYKSADISRGVLAMGLASEICLAEGRFKESVLWRKRYSDGVSAFTVPRNARARSRCFI